MPEVVGTVKIAKLFDGMRDGIPFVVDRPPLPPGRERSVFLTYLRQGKVILRAAGLSADRLDESRGKQVPIIYQTDGEWVWSGSVAYYLEEHDLPPEPAFLDYLRGRNLAYEAPTPEQIDAAAAAIQAQ